MPDQRTMQEKLIHSLRGLYLQYGYGQFKMSKFEPYDLYMQNKEFLVSDGIITFTDTDGTLMALKPDVTLSIVKNYRTHQASMQKVCYSENVYRSVGTGHGYREIMQTGLECMGDIGLYEISEVVLLAAKSLSQVSDRWILDLSHVDLIFDLLSRMGLSGQQMRDVTKALSERNEDALRKCLTESQAEVLLQLMQVHGPISQVLHALPKEICGSYWNELSVLAEILEQAGFGERVQLDFSIINDHNYYNGIVFRGYVEGLPSQVLSGGQYDNLMKKMQKQAKGIGFAVYLDQLDRLNAHSKTYDVDTVLLYDAGGNPVDIASAAESLKSDGVLVLKQIPAQLRYRRLMKLTDGKLEEIETHG